MSNLLKQLIAVVVFLAAMVSTSAQAAEWMDGEKVLDASTHPELADFFGDQNFHSSAARPWAPGLPGALTVMLGTGLVSTSNLFYSAGKNDEQELITRAVSEERAFELKVSYLRNRMRMNTTRAVGATLIIAGSTSAIAEVVIAGKRGWRPNSAVRNAIEKIEERRRLSMSVSMNAIERSIDVSGTF